MRNDLQEIGEEGFREIISRNSNHLLALLAHGTICLSTEKYDESRTFLEKCLEISPGHTLVSTIMVTIFFSNMQGILYETINDDIEAEKFFAIAKSKDSSSYFYQAAEFAIQLNCGSVADKALAHELILNGPNIAPYLLLSKLESQRNNFLKALDALLQALQISKSDPSVWAEIGTLK